MQQLEGNLKNIMLSKSLTQKSAFHVTPFTWSSGTGKTNMEIEMTHYDCLWVTKDKDWLETSLRELSKVKEIFYILIEVCDT